MPIIPRKPPSPVAAPVLPESPVRAGSGVEEPVKRKSRIRLKAAFPPPAPAASLPAAAEPSPPSKKGRGHPPAEHQFRKGNKGGPGRPKGSRNHTTLMKERFEKRRPLRIDGVERLATQHEILIDMRFKQALEGKEKPLAQLLGEAARLYPSNDDSGHPVGAAGLPVTRAEQAILDQIFAGMNLSPMLGLHLPLTPGTLEEFLGDPDEDEAEQTR